MILLSPWAALDAVILALLGFFLGHLFFQEKLLLLVLLCRPLIDAWRDVTVFAYEQITVNMNAALSIIFAFWSLFILFRHKKMLTAIPALPIGAILLGFMLMSTWWSVSPRETIIESIKWFNALGVFALAYIGVMKKHFTRKELWWALIASAVVPIIIGILQAMVGAGLTTTDLHGRIYGTLAHPNVFAFLIVGVLILLFDTKNALPYRRLMAPILLVALLFTYTRAAIIGIVLYGIVLGLILFKQKFLKLFLVAFTACALILSIHNLFSERFNLDITRVPIISRLVTRNEDADSLAWRQSLLRESIPLIATRSFLGYGFGTFATVWSENRSLTHLWDDSAEAHNDYLRIALELGGIGLALYLAFLGQILFSARKNPRLFAWIFMFIVVSLSENMLHHTPVLWFTFAWWGATLRE